MSRHSDSTAPSGLVRALGTRALAATIFNVTVGGGIFLLPAAAAAELGAAAPVAYLVCAVAIGLIVLCFAEAGSRVTLTGGPYAYVEVALGSYAGFLAGVLLWLLGSFGMAAVASGFAGSLGALWPAVSGQGARAVVLVSVFGFFAWVNVRGVRASSRLLEGVTVAKLLPLLLFVGVGAFFVRPAALAFTMPAPGDVARASVVLIFAFAGVESALAPSGEVRDPARTVPRALAIAMVGVTLLYLALQLVAQGILGADLASATVAPLADAAGRAMGRPGRVLLLAGAVISMFGYVSGMTLAIPRALFALARDGFLPRAVARVHPRHHTPWVAVLVQATIAAVLALLGTFERLAILANVSALFLYLLCAVAAWLLRRRDVREGGVPFRVPGGNVVPWLAVAVILWLLAGATRQELAAVGVVLVVASAVYVVVSWRRAAAPDVGR